MRLPGTNNELVCQQVVELVTDYLEDSLTRSQRRRFDAHLAGCEHCTEYLAQMRATIRLTGRLEAEDLTPDMRAEFSTLYRRWRAGEQSAGADAPADP
jgi:anti-sigma factor RsiW